MLLLLVKILVSTDFTGSVSLNSSILLTELNYNMLFEIKWVMKSVEGNNTSPLTGKIPSGTFLCTWGCFTSIRHALQHLLLSQFATTALRSLKDSWAKFRDL